MDLLLRLFALLATGVFLLAVLLVLLTFRRARRVTAAGLLVPVGMSLAVLALYCAILGATPRAVWVVVGLIGGGAAGALWARTHRLFRGGDGAVRSRANLWYLAVWASVLALNQLVAVVAGRSSRVLVGLLVFSTGIALGNGLALLRRLRRLRAVALALAVLPVVATPARAARGSDVCTIEVVAWAEESPAQKARFTFEVRGDAVTAHAEWKVQQNQGQWSRSTSRFEGTLKDNVIRGRTTIAHEPYRTEHSWEADDNGHHVQRTCRFESWGEATQDEVWTLLPGGRGEARSSARGVTHGRGSPDCPEMTKDHRWESAESTTPFTWQVRGPHRCGLEPQAATGAPSSRPGAGQEGKEGEGEETGPGGDERSASEEGESRDAAGEPVSPAEAAGAAAGAAAVSLLGAVWMLVSTGVRPSDLLSAPPSMEADLPPAMEAGLTPVEPPVVHRDGDVRPESGERWSAFDRGWIGADEYARRQGVDQAEIARAQQVSREEAQRRSAEIAEGLRESEARQREAASAQADAARIFEREASQRPETIEPYTPAWSDRVASGLALGEQVADNAVSVLGELTGKAGQVGGRIYTVTKETLKGASEGVAAYARGQGGAFAENGSAWVIAERAGIGLAKGGAKVGLDMAAGKVLEGVAKLGRRSIPDLPDLGAAAVVDVVGEVATRAGEGAARQAVGIAIGKTAGSQVVQAPVGMAVKATTGQEL